MTSKDGSNGLKNGFCWTDGLWKVRNFFDGSLIRFYGSLAKYLWLLWWCSFVDRLCLKIFEIQKVCFQLFCFSTDLNFDHRFLEGMTGAFFVIWFWRHLRNWATCIMCVCTFWATFGMHGNDIIWVIIGFTSPLTPWSYFFCPVSKCVARHNMQNYLVR